MELLHDMASYMPVIVAFEYILYVCVIKIPT